MNFKIGDIVTRISYNNDIPFIITDIEDNISYLKGLNIRLEADADISDLTLYTGDDKDEIEFAQSLKPIDLNRDDYFYIPGKILHIDADKDYLKRCLNYYEKMNIWAKGVVEKEEDIKLHIKDLINEYNPNIVVITGHDAYYSKLGDKSYINAYKNSMNFIEGVKEARKVEKSHDKLIIIAGACQSDYEELIKAGANFASSPKRINIHALDPAIIASKMSLSEVSKDIDLKSILESTKYGSSGMGGVKTKGTMYIGYPR